MNRNFNGAGSTTLLSPTVLAVMHCSQSMIFPEIRLFDLENMELLTNPEPIVILTLPHFKPVGSIPPKMTYHSAFFLCGSSLNLYDIQKSTQRSGETDVIPIVLRMTREYDTDPHYRLYLFVSKKFLLDCVIERSRQRELNAKEPETDSSRDTSATPIAPTQSSTRPAIIHYKNWGKKYARWINGTELRSISRCSSYGSRVVFVVNPSMYNPNHPLTPFALYIPFRVLQGKKRCLRVFS